MGGVNEMGQNATLKKYLAGSQETLWRRLVNADTRVYVPNHLLYKEFTSCMMRMQWFSN